MRSNIDYGAAVLPVGSAQDYKNSCLSRATTQDSAALLATMLASETGASSRNCAAHPEIEQDETSPGREESCFDEPRLHKQLENALSTVMQEQLSEVSIKVAPEILPATSLKIRKINDGLHIDIESASDETRHWLRSIQTRLSSQLCRKLDCLVEVNIVERNIFLHQADLESMKKNARNL